MTKRVVRSDQALHLWAHQSQDSARNNTGSVLFEGDTCYSYGRHFPMATIYAATGGHRLVLMTTERYGVTTAKHLSMMRRAASHLPSVDVPHVKAGAPTGRVWHNGNLIDIERRIQEHLSEAKRAMQARNVEWRRGDAERLDADHATYRAFFKIRGKAPAFPRAEFDAALARAQAIENPDPVRDAKRFKARVAREKARETRLAALREKFAADNAEKAAAWRAGENVHFNAGFYQLPRANRRALEYGRGMPVMLRVNGAEIETSQGARIPLDHAPRIWKLIQSVRAAGREYVRNGHTEHAGKFAIDRVTVDGTLTAGCHTIQYAELARLAGEIGLDV